MKKRIGSKLYDTDSSECLGTVDGGILFRKKTRDRERFILTDDGRINPLESQHADPLEYRVRIDRETYRRISAIAKAEHIPLSEVVKRAVSNF